MDSQQLGKVVINNMASNFEPAGEFKRARWIGPIRDGKWKGYIDWNGEWVLRTEYADLGEFREGLAAFQSASRIGFIDEAGDIVIPPQFDVATFILPHFREGLAPVYLDGKATYIDREGRILYSGEDALAWNFMDGRAILGGQDRYVVIDREWREVSRFSVYEIPYFFDFPEDWDFFPCLTYGDDKRFRRAYINWRGEYVFPPIYAEVGPFNDGLAPFSPDEQFGPCGLVHLSGEVIHEPTFESIGVFSAERLAPAAREKNRYGYINTSGEWVIPPIYQQALSFCDGLACVTVPDGSRHGTKGFINSAGEMVIEPRFHRQSNFHEGWAWVECNGMNQIIDRRGTVIWESPIPNEP